MLTTFRQGGLIKVLMGGVVALIIAAFAFDFRSGNLSNGKVCVVEVEDSCVEPSEFHALLRLVAPAGMSNKKLRQAGFTQHAISAFVERELLLQEARRLGVSASEEDLDDELGVGRVHFSWPADAPIPAALAAGRSFPPTGAAETTTYIRVKSSKTDAFDFNVYQRQVQSIMRMTHKEFKRHQLDELIAARVRAMVTAPIRVSEGEVFSQFERARSTATARTVEADADWFARVGAPLSDEAVEAFAAEHKESIDKAWEAEKERWVADCPLVSEWLFELPSGASEEDQAEQRTRAEEALAMLKKGIPFASVARLSSDHTDAQFGGIAGCLTPQSGPGAGVGLQALEGVAPGGVTSPLDSPQGVHVYRFEGRLGASDVESSGRLYIARRLATEASGRQRALEFAKRLIEKGKQGGSLKDHVESSRAEYVQLDAPAALNQEVLSAALSDKRAPTMEISRTFTRSSSPIFGVKGDVNAASEVFALEKPDDFVAAPIETHAGFAVLQLKERTPVTRDDFNEKKADIIRSVQEHKRAEALSRYVAGLRKRADRIIINPDFGSLGEQDEGSESQDSG